MTYTAYIQQTVFETEGSLDLLSDNSQQIYTQLGGKKIFFTLSDGRRFTKQLYSSVPWDFHSAEKEGSYIKLIAKNRRTIANHSYNISETRLDQNFFEVYTFDFEGKLLAAEVPPSQKNGFDTSITQDKSRLAELGVTSSWTDLETWGIQNLHLLTESEVALWGDIRLERWAYYKYKDLYPNQPMLKGLGVEDGESLNNGDNLFFEGDNSNDVMKGGAGDDTLKGGSGDDILKASGGKDLLYGGSGNDDLRGSTHGDTIFGESGSDTLHGGNGRDILTGGSGGDFIYGGFGHNTFSDEKDGSRDRLYFKSDQFAENWLYGRAGMNPNGQKVDIIKGLDKIDRLFVEGVETSELIFSQVNSFAAPTGVFSGIGIYANGFLEGLYTGGDLTSSQLQSMTTGVDA